MQLYNFLPQKYKDIKLRKNKKLILIIKLNLIIFNIVFSIIFYNNIIKLHMLTNVNYNTMINKVISKNTPIKNLKSLNSLIKFQNLDIKYKKIDVKGLMINIDIPIANMSECLKIVKNIESNKEYKIMEISPMKKDGEKYIFNIQLEVIK